MAAATARFNAAQLKRLELKLQLQVGVGGEGHAEELRALAEAARREEGEAAALMARTAAAVDSARSQRSGSSAPIAGVEANHDHKS